MHYFLLFVLSSDGVDKQALHFKSLDAKVHLKVQCSQQQIVA